MNKYAFEKKNTENFESNTQKIEKALNQIERDESLRPTIKQLSEMTKLHRNTLSKRAFVIQKLRAIKRIRENDSQTKKSVDTLSKTNPIQVLEEKISKLQIEALYWFNEYKKLKNSYDYLKKQHQKLRESQQYYRSLCESENRTIAIEKEEAQESLAETTPFQPTDTKQ